MNRPNDELQELSHYADRLSREVNEYRNILTFYREHIMWETDNGLMENGLSEEEVQDYRQEIRDKLSEKRCRTLQIWSDAHQIYRSFNPDELSHLKWRIARENLESIEKDREELIGLSSAGKVLLEES